TTRSPTSAWPTSWCWRCGAIRQRGSPRPRRIGRARPTSSRPRAGCGSGSGEPDAGQFERSETVEACVGYTVLARRETIERCGGFDDAYNPYGWEEVEWSLRIRAAGFTIRY